MPVALLTAKAKLIGEVRLISDKGAGLISDNGAVLISNNGVGVIANNGSGVIANNGSGVIANNGSGVVANNGSGWSPTMAGSTGCTRPPGRVAPGLRLY